MCLDDLRQKFFLTREAFNYVIVESMLSTGLSILIRDEQSLAPILSILSLLGSEQAF